VNVFFYIISNPPQSQKRTDFELNIRQHFFSDGVSNIWNKLDKDTVCASSPNSFKQHIQKLYQDGSFHRLLQSVASQLGGKPTGLQSIGRRTNQLGDNQLGDTFRSTRRQCPQTYIWCILYVYIRQVNVVNGGYTVMLAVVLSFCRSVRTQYLDANISKTG